MILVALFAFMTLPFSVKSFCPDPYINAPNQGNLIPYYENQQLLGEKCVWGGTNCSCIGMIYWY